MCSEMIVSTYIPNMPSQAGIRAGEKFNYSHFPSLSGGRSASLVPVVKTLQRTAEHRRLVSASAQAAVMNQSSSRRRRNSSVSRASGQQEDANILYDGKQRFIRISKAFTALKSLFRMQPFRKHFKLQKASCIKIQRTFRFVLLRRLSRRYNQQQQIILRRIQNTVRCFMTRRHFLKMRKSAIAIQAAFRRHTCAVAYQSMKRRIIALQSVRRGWMARSWYNRTMHRTEGIQKAVRGYLARKSTYNMREQILSALREVIFLLFKMNNTPLQERSLFWLSSRRNSFMSLAVHREQVFVLWKALKLLAVEAEHLEGSIFSMQQHAGRVLTYTRDRAHDVPDSAEVTNERTQLYTALKSGGGRHNDSMFAAFGIENEKKRKRNLTSMLLWRNYATADASAKIVLEIVGVEYSSLEVWSTEVGRMMVMKRLADVARSCMSIVAMEKYY
jgi:hypothetical protein